MTTDVLYNRKTAAERQAAFRKRKAAEGFAQVYGYVHPHQLPGVLQIIEMLRQAPGLEVGSPRNIASGRLHKLR